MPFLQQSLNVKLSVIRSQVNLTTLGQFQGIGETLCHGFCRLPQQYLPGLKQPPFLSARSVQIFRPTENSLSIHRLRLRDQLIFSKHPDFHAVVPLLITYYYSLIQFPHGLNDSFHRTDVKFRMDAFEIVGRFVIIGVIFDAKVYERYLFAVKSSLV